MLPGQPERGAVAAGGADPAMSRGAQAPEPAATEPAPGESAAFAEPEPERPTTDPTTFVIAGATGDLARRKLLPAIYNLAHEGALPERFHLVGTALDELPDEGFRELARESIQGFSRRRPDDAVLSGLLSRMRYVAGSFDDPEPYRAIASICAEHDAEAGQPTNRAFYLSTAPSFFPTIVGKLGELGLHRHPGADVRVVVEKPIGTNLAEARALNRELLAVLDERQAYRIDHYLGKETVQNLLAFRFANGLFEPIWSRNFIDQVQITAAEDLGIGGRAGYYDSSGALRDLVQNHMLQLLTLLCMEPPVSFSADAVRGEKVKVLQAIAPPDPERTEGMAVRAQYAAGVSGGEPVAGYLEEDGVAPGSTTESYVALRLEVDNWRWAGVPIYLRTGKRLARKVTEIAVTLRPVPHLAFAEDGSIGVQPNQIVLALQPNEGVSISLGAKVPGGRMRIRPVNMQFMYGTSFPSESPEAYERLIADVLRGDPTLFTRDDEVEEQWRICDPILDGWAREPGPLPRYEAGSGGPAEADSILREGHAWRAI